MMFKERSYTLLKRFVHEHQHVRNIIGTPVDKRWCDQTTILDQMLDALMYMCRAHALQDWTNVHFKTVLEMAHDIELIRCFGSQTSQAKMSVKFTEVQEQLGSYTTHIFDLAAENVEAIGPNRGAVLEAAGPRRGAVLEVIVSYRVAVRKLLGPTVVQTSYAFRG